MEMFHYPLLVDNLAAKDFFFLNTQMLFATNNYDLFFIPLLQKNERYYKAAKWSESSGWSEHLADHPMFISSS